MTDRSFPFRGLRGAGVTPRAEVLLSGAAMGAGLAALVVLASGWVPAVRPGALVQGLGLGAALLALACLLLLRAIAAAGLSRTGFGICNHVTLLRLALACLLAGVVAVPGLLDLPPVGYAALGIALLALALDGLDGWLARRRGEASAFGARFDMEVDAALILVLAVLAWLGDKAGAWVLALGLMRYGFVAGAALWPWLAAPLPESFRRKAVCVLQVAVLAALLAPLVTPPISGALALAALAALGWSFAVDILWLWTRRHRTRPRTGPA